MSEQGRAFEEREGITIRGNEIVEVTCEPGCACGDPTLCGTASPDEVHVAQRDRLAQALRLLRDTTSEGGYVNNVAVAALTEARIPDPEDDGLVY